MQKKSQIICVILAGGKGSRLDGKGKFLTKLGDLTLLEHVYRRIINQTSKVAINFNKKQTKLFNIKEDIIYDFFSEDVGPLAGIHCALKYSYEKYGKESLVCTVPVDAPFLPLNLINKLLKNIKQNNNEIVVSKSNYRIHPTTAIWKARLFPEIESAIKKDIRKIDIFTKKFSISTVTWKVKKFDPFFNINNYEDLKIAENMLKKNLIN